MPMYIVYADVIGSASVKVEAPSEEEARDLAVDRFDVQLCHYCSAKLGELEVEVTDVEVSK
jgi:hypothetical protein